MFYFALKSKLFHITSIGYCVPKIKEVRTMGEVAGYNGGGYGSVGAVLVLFILLVIILSAFGFGFGV